MSNLLFSDVKMAEVDAGEKSGSDLGAKSNLGEDSNQDLALHYLNKMSEMLKSTQRNPAPSPHQEIPARRPPAHARGSCVAEPSWMKPRGIGS